MPDSAAERAARYRAKHGTRINKNRVLNRVKGGSLPTWNSMEKYDIGLPAINTIKNETKQPLIYEPNQLSEERGKPMKERGDTKYAQTIQIEVPAPIPPRFTTPAKLARVARKARVVPSAGAPRGAASSSSGPSTGPRVTPGIEWLNRLLAEAPDLLNTLDMPKKIERGVINIRRL